MKVSEAIEGLQTLDPNEEIVIAWWDRYGFEHLSDEEWDQLISKDTAGKIDWSNTWELLELMATDK